MRSSLSSPFRAVLIAVVFLAGLLFGAPRHAWAQG